MHCRLPYTAPPVHLKADMDGPLSNRGEKVNGARLGMVGESLPARDGFLAGTMLLRGRPSLPRIRQPPPCPLGSRSSSVFYGHGHSKGLLVAHPHQYLAFFPPRFVNLVTLLTFCGSRKGSYHTTLHPTLSPALPPFSFLSLAVE